MGCAGGQVRDEAKREAAMAEVVRALLDLEAGTKRNWRMQQQLAASFPSFPQVRSGAPWLGPCVFGGWRRLYVCGGGWGWAAAAIRSVLASS